MAVVAVVSTLHECFQLGHVIRMCEVNHIDTYVVALKSFAEVLALRQVLFDWMTNECNYALPLVLVHAMF